MRLAYYRLDEDDGAGKPYIGFLEPYGTHRIIQFVRDALNEDNRVPFVEVVDGQLKLIKSLNTNPPPSENLNICTQIQDMPGWGDLVVAVWFNVDSEPDEDPWCRIIATAEDAGGREELYELTHGRVEAILELKLPITHPEWSGRYGVYGTQKEVDELISLLKSQDYEVTEVIGRIYLQTAAELIKSFRFPLTK